MLISSGNIQYFLRSARISLKSFRHTKVFFEIRLRKDLYVWRFLFSLDVNSVDYVNYAKHNRKQKCADKQNDH